MKFLKNTARLKQAGFIVLLLFLVSIPVFSTQFFLTMMIRYMYFGLLTISFSFLAGQLGLFSLMVPVSFTITAYTIAICQVKNIMPLQLSLPLGFAIALIFAAVCGVMVNKTKETSFLMLTLVLSQLVWSIALQWTDLTNGSTGLLGIQFPEALNIFGDKPNVNQYYWTFILFGICIVLVWLLTRSSYGMRLRGIRDSESRMIALGYNTAALKWSAFMISAVISSVSGILFLYYTGMISPDLMSMNSSNQALISSILGGTNSIIGGSVLGTVINRTLELTLSGITKRYALVTGLLFLTVILVIPDGLTSVFERFKRGRKEGGELK